MPESAALAALAALLEAHPEAQAELTKQAKANPVLAGEIRDLAAAHGAVHPAIANAAKEI